MSQRFIRELRILCKSTAASAAIAGLAFIFFEILIRAGNSPAISSVVSTIFLSILGAPLLRMSFESEVSLKSAYTRYGILATFYTIIVYFTFPGFNTYFGDILHVSDLMSLIGLKIVYYPFYYIIAKYYIFK